MKKCWSLAGRSKGREWRKDGIDSAHLMDMLEQRLSVSQTEVAGFLLLSTVHTTKVRANVGALQLGKLVCTYTDHPDSRFMPRAP